MMLIKDLHGKEERACIFHLLSTRPMLELHNCINLLTTVASEAKERDTKLALRQTIFVENIRSKAERTS